MTTINPYIHFNGNALEAFNFYKSIFGGEFETVSYFKDLPNPDIAKEEENNIMHISLPIGGDSILMGSDTPSFMGKHNLNENRSKISVQAANKKEADEIFIGLSKDGQIEMPIADSPWGSYFGMLRDKYGIEWMVNFDYKLNKINK